MKPPFAIAVSAKTLCLIACLMASFPRVSALGQGDPASTHRLGPQDVIEVTVFREPDLTVRLTMSKETKAAMPLIGEVSLGGLTTAEASRVIAARYEDGYLVDPKVSISLVKEARKTFTVIGAVIKPQSYYIPEGAGSVSLLKAIGMAGGFNRLANKKKLLITRPGMDGPITVTGEKVSNFEIRPDDVIEVKESIF